ncbi:MAG: hypothetical protein ACIALR_05635 [Blastopirellula sp. JB062]
MKYVEFEFQLQELLDERRYHEARRLLDQVAPEDRSRCERLAAAYDTLFDGLEAWNPPPCDAALADRVLAQLPTTPPTDLTPAPRLAKLGDWLPMAALAFAASLLILAFIPFSLRQEKDDRVGTYVATTDDPAPLIGEETLHWEDAQYVYPVRSPFDIPWELTSELVTQTTTAPRLPLDPTSLSVATLDAQPWLHTVQHPFRPLTNSMGSALMVIKEATLPHSSRRSDDRAKPQARGASLPLAVDRRIT